MFQKLFTRLNKFKSAFLAEFGRTAWATFFFFIGALFILHSGRELLQQQFGVLAWKLVLVGTAVFVAHVVRRQLFPYLDLSAVLNEKSSHGAITFLGIAILYSAIILAICSGL
jgi:formate-dependent nitrite reductase membrane component NrfD